MQMNNKYLKTLIIIFVQLHSIAAQMFLAEIIQIDKYLLSRKTNMI